MPATRVLIVDDEPAIARVLRPALVGHDFNVAVAATGVEGLQQLERFGPDLILLDLGLPDVDGLDLLRRIRAASAVPVIILSVRGGEPEKISALDLGADDYLTKPFGIGELLARIRVALRHAHPDEPARQEPIHVGDLVIDTAAHTASIRNQPLHLSPTEFDLLALLAANAGRVSTHRTLLHRVWGPEYTSDTQLLRVYIGQLRRKIEERPERPIYILTEPGVGYRFRDPD